MWYRNFYKFKIQQQKKLLSQPELVGFVGFTGQDSSWYYSRNSHIVTHPSLAKPTSANGATYIHSTCIWLQHFSIVLLVLKIVGVRAIFIWNIHHRFHRKISSEIFWTFDQLENSRVLKIIVIKLYVKAWINLKLVYPFQVYYQRVF